MAENRTYLTNTELDEACAKIVQKIKAHRPEYGNRIEFMYLYGCRIGELFDNRISFNATTGNVEIIAQKGNNVRINPMVNIKVPQIVEEINLTDDNFWVNKRNLQRVIEQHNPYSSLWCGEKNIGAHMFRHNWIKKMVAAGYQIETINQMLGYTTQTIADTYLISKIYYKS